MFKIGDKVRCIDKKFHQEYLTFGKVYEVSGVDEEFIDILIDDTGRKFCQLWEGHFEKVEQ